MRACAPAGSPCGWTTGGDWAARETGTVTDDATRRAPRPRSDPIPAEARAANLKLWNAWTKVHETSPGYDVAGFKVGRRRRSRPSSGGARRHVHEGASLLHLQCHFGLDTLSWARKGAEVVGLDFSDEAIGAGAPPGRRSRPLGARHASSRATSTTPTSTSATGASTSSSSTGARSSGCPTCRRWAGIIARHLRPGGIFYMAEIHPIARTFEEVPGDREVQVVYRYFPAPDKPDVDAVRAPTPIPTRDFEDLSAYGWPHSMDEVIGRCATPVCASSSCTSSPSRRPRSGTGWAQDDDAPLVAARRPGRERGTICPSATRSRRPRRR